ncbi:hypothetical protein Poli38472_012289 [Pythium oligandrum]|uniref:PX domain-containing protein n=1 Tax=Pythium oligandrum TaxID=41045 RepID=A0A8K1CQK9_PYTOL|nr:hypothetical protein Poli38472_012289 [Pythium oligandrum]|eukprot:TMW67173.1 hypothetical protein Poli38472_012289 [Pythium oligandrum]
MDEPARAQNASLAMAVDLVATLPPVAPALAHATSSSLEMKRESSEERERIRGDSIATDARLSIHSTSGTVYESVVVVGHIYGTDNVVYYLLEVRSWENPLEGYVIRRRYNDFKQLHKELAECMPTPGNHNVISSRNSRPVRRASLPLANPFATYYSSLLCNPLANQPPETSALWSPTRTPNGGRRGSIAGLRLHGIEGNGDVLPTTELRTPSRFGIDFGAENDTRFSAPAIVMHPTAAVQAPTGVRNYYANPVELPFDRVKFNATGRPYLPPMPSGGVTSFFSSREMLIKHRIEQFNLIIAAVLSDTSPSVSQLLMKFIQDNPSAQIDTYVSLSQYAAIDMPWSVERHARRRAMSVSKKVIRDPFAMAAS